MNPCVLMLAKLNKIQDFRAQLTYLCFIQSVITYECVSVNELSRAFDNLKYLI